MTDIPWGEQPTEVHVWLETNNPSRTGWYKETEDYFDSMGFLIMKCFPICHYTVHRKPEPKAFEPIVGQECEYISGIMKGIVIIKAATDQHVIFTEKGKSNEQVVTYDITKFFPIKSDREVFIEKANSVKKAHHWTDKEWLGAMFDAGFKAPEGDL